MASQVMKANEQVQQRSEAIDFDKLKDLEQTQMADDLNILNRVQSLEGKVVLDLGCGTGNYTYKLAKRVGPTGRVTGVDPNRERIKIAREKWRRDNLTFIEGDDQSFPEDQYDLIFSNYTLHLIENKKETFEKVYKNLHIGGEFAFIAVNGSIPIEEEMSSLMGEEVHKNINNHRHFISAGEYQQIAINAGFTVTLIEEDCDTYTFPNIGAMISSWHGITEGRFDPQGADTLRLQEFKQKYKGKKVEQPVPVIRMILTKL